MLWVDGKKTDTAFGRLRERRKAVGIDSTAETPEEEAKRIEREIATAAATADISTILRIVAQSSSMTAKDFIKKTCGGLFFMYYVYVDKFHQKPVDIDDLVDGLLYLDAKEYIIKQAMKKDADK